MKCNCGCEPIKLRLVVEGDDVELEDVATGRRLGAWIDLDVQTSVHDARKATVHLYLHDENGRIANP